MEMCAMPGCVGQAVKGKWCAVHGTPGLKAKRCESCKGTGRHFYSGQGITMACQICGGTGMRDQHAPRVPKQGTDHEPIDERGLIKAQE